MSREPIIFHTGEVNEQFPWQIQYDVEGSGEKEPCKHCVDVKKEMTVWGGSDEEYSWICPSVVYAVTEGGYNITRLCLQCILEAVKDIEVKEKQ